MRHGVIQALGGLGLFLFGMAVMTDGLKSLAGPAVARVLARFTRTPATGALTGALATVVVQSSSATTVAAVGFVAAGLIAFPQALSIILGASVGTTTTGWLVALLGFKVDLAAVAPLIVFAGVLLRMLSPGRWGRVGGALCGFGLVFTGLGVMQQAMTVFEAGLRPGSLPAGTGWGRVQLALLGVLFSAVTRSSTAGVAAALAALHSGTIDLPQALALVVGMNVGTATTAITSAVGGSVEAKRTGWAHGIYNGITGAGAFLLIPLYAAIVARAGPHDPGIALVAFHSGFNVLGVAAILPFTAAFARLIERLVRDAGAPAIRLDPALLKEPAVAVEAATDGIRRLQRAIFRETVRSLRGARDERSPPAAVDHAAEIRAARDLLFDLHTRPEERRIHERHVALMHAVDHLDRLHRRSVSALLPDDPGTPALRGAARSLAAQLVVAARRLRDRSALLDEAAAKARWRELQAFGERFRRANLRRAASGRLDDHRALARTSEARRITRAAYHAWRLAVHWNRIAPRPALDSSPPAGQPAPLR